jgi:hypothetical protein
MSQKQKFRNYLPARGAWALLRDEYNEPHRVAIQSWAEGQDGEMYGMIAGPQGLVAAKSFPNFIRYEAKSQRVEF